MKETSIKFQSITSARHEIHNCVLYTYMYMYMYATCIKNYIHTYICVYMYLTDNIKIIISFVDPIT